MSLGFREDGGNQGTQESLGFLGRGYRTRWRVFHPESSVPCCVLKSKLILTSMTPLMIHLSSPTSNFANSVTARLTSIEDLV